MIRKIYSCLAFAILALNANVCYGQGLNQPNTKFDFYLAVKQQSYLAGKINGTDLLPVFVKGNITAIKKLVENNHGIFKYAYGSIAAVQIPVSALPAFMASKDVTRMEGKPAKMQALNDTMRVRSHVVEVHMGQTPLTQSYEGKGIIEGFVDSGIDFLHPDFRDSSGTRIQYMWDQNLAGGGPNCPQPFNYGQAWSKHQMDSVTGVSFHDTAGVRLMDSSSTLIFGHGSNVAGVAAANNHANGLNMGTAPKSDIIMVAYNFNSGNPNLMTDAVNYIYSKADLLGEPCVINASLGDYNGSHDGFDLQAQMIDSMTLAKPGRCFVAASGNAGNVPYHVGYNVVNTDTNFTWFAFDGAQVDIQVFADTAQFRNVHFSIGADANSPAFYHSAQTSFHTIFPYIGNLVTDTIKNAANQRLGIMQTYAQRNGGVYYLEFYIIPDSTTYYWRFSATGAGKFDCWDFPYAVYSGLPNAIQFPDIAHYKMPDTFETVCSSFQCSPHTITVGNYWNRGLIVDYDTQLVNQPAYVPCMLVGGSSVGPTRDGRNKPDITAPGNRIMSALPTQFHAYDIANAPTSIDIGGWHNVDGGTSMASPGVAGAAGLLLEMFPTATNDEIKGMIECGATQDNCTGHSLPDNDWGYGKLNVFNSMTQCILGYQQVAAPISPSSLGAYPNPVTQKTEIVYDFSYLKEFCTASIEMYDVYGKDIKNIELKNNNGRFVFNKEGLAPGSYYYSLIVDGKRLKTEKLIIL